MVSNDTVLENEDTSNNLFSQLSLEQLRKRTSEKWRFYEPDVLPLWVAEMDAKLAPSVAKELIRLVDLGDTGYDSGVDGKRYLEAYRGFAKRRWNADIDVSAGRTTVDVISGLRAVIVATLGQRPVAGSGASSTDFEVNAQTRFEGTVVVQTPIYPPFLHRLPQDYTLVASPLDPQTHHTDFDNLEAVFKNLPEPKRASKSGYNSIFVLCTPHNPTGTVFGREELTRIAELCEQYHVRLIADEIHAPIVVEGASFVPLLTVPQASKAIVSVSASKGFSLPGFKAAMLIPGPDSEAAKTLAALTQDDVHTGAHVASNVHAAAFEAGDEWLNAMVQGLAQNERIFRSAVGRQLPKAHIVLGHGTYLAFLDLSAYVAGTQWDGNPSEGLLRKAKVAFNPGGSFGGAEWANYVRVNLATNPAIIEEAVQRTARFVASL